MISFKCNTSHTIYIIACVYFIENFCTMLFIPACFLLKHKRKLEIISSLAQIFLLILSISVNSNEASVIKKRDVATSSGNTDLELKELQVLPTILTKLNKTNSMVSTSSTKLQPMFVANFTGETSREVANNEILFNEAKKLSTEPEKTNKQLGIDAAAETLETNLKSPGVSQQDFKQIKENLESEAVTPQVTTEFSSNDIKEEEKIPKLVKQHVMSSSQDKVDFKDYENAGSLENSLKVYDSNPRPPSKILTELRSVTVTETETEKPLNKAQDQNKQLENSIDSDKDNIKIKFEKEAKHNKEQITIKPLPATTAKAEQLDLLETSTLPTRVTANKQQVIQTTTLNPLKDLDTKNEIKFLDSLTEVQTKDQQANKIGKDLEKTLFTSSPTLLSLEANKLETLTKEFNKTNHARAIVMAETTSAANIELPEATTFEPVIEGGQTLANLTNLNVKGKKPKFINDNSTNAQQLNLPNNAEVWSLAAMKSLPTKLNLTNSNTETEHTTNQTDKENTTHTNTSASNLSLNNNSEKNLLDWSQIMMDKELSTTTRNKDDNSLQEMEIATDMQQNPQIMMDTTTWRSAETSSESSEIMEHYELSTTTVMPFIAPPTTILSILNASEADKKTEEKFTTTVATNMANNPFNTSLNIEPNLNEINLTLNQTQHVLNNNTTTAAKKSVDDDDDDDDDDVTYTVTTENSVAALMTTKTTKLATTEATAVVEMTTVEQISSETTTVSAYETTKQYASLSNGNVIINQTELNIKNNKNENQNQNDNVINKESNSSAIEISQNELENKNVVVKQNKQNEIIDTNTITTTTATVIPITTFRPSTILAIPTSTTSLPKTFKQEVDQNSNEIQKNLTNSQQQQQSISKTATDLNDNQLTKSNETHLIEREYETTTTTELKGHNTENNTLMTTAATSYSKDEQINETTEINLDLRETATATTTTTEAVSTTTAVAAVETTPKPVNESTKVQIETTTGSSVLTDEKLEKENKTSEINFSKNTFYTSTETPVVSDVEGDKATTTTTISPSTSTPPLKTIGTTGQTIIENTTLKKENDIKENILTEEDAKTDTSTTTTITVMNNTTETTTITTPVTVTKEEETYKNLLDDTTTTTTATAATYTSTISTTDTSPKPTTTPTTSTLATTTISPPPSSTSTLPSAIPTKVQETYNVINSTTTELIETTTQQLVTEIETESSTDPTVYSSTTNPTITGAYFEEMLPTAPTTHSTPMIDTANIGKSLPTLTSIMGGNSGNMYPKNSNNVETDVNVIIAITVSVIGVVALILLVGFLYLMRKRQKQTSYSQRCRPVLEDYTIDNLSVGGSMRKSCTLRVSKRTYGNLAFDDPALRPNPLGVHELAKFAQEKLRIFEEFREVPQITSRLDEVPSGCEDKNRYANVLPLPETRVILQRLNDDEKSEYINANYVTGPKDAPNYYIACQAPLESTVEDFWRMIWEQQSRVIIQATDLIENGVEKCAEYLPPSATLDNHSSFGDFQITLQNREVKDKYAISTILLKHVSENATRELTHYWYKWPEVGVPSEEAPIIAMLLEARSSLISYAIEQANEDKEKSLKSAEEGLATPNDSLALPTNNTSNSSSANGSSGEINGNISMVHIKKNARNQGPLTIHCSPGTGRTGTIIACDIAIRSLETPKRTVDIPQIVYYVRRGRASAIRTKDQYEFIYKVANMYAAKITNPTNYN